MKLFCHTIYVLGILIFLNACGTSDVYKEKAKTIDSLCGAVNTVALELAKVDTTDLSKAVTRFVHYKQFIRQNFNDTLNRNDANILQHFYQSGKSLQDFSGNRSAILARLNLINSQLLKLKQDLQNNSVGMQEMARYIMNEKNEAEKLIEVAARQQTIFRCGIEEFKNILRDVEQMIRARNQGSLPTIVNETI